MGSVKHIALTGSIRNSSPTESSAFRTSGSGGLFFIDDVLCAGERLFEPPDGHLVLFSCDLVGSMGCVSQVEKLRVRKLP